MRETYFDSRTRNRSHGSQHYIVLGIVTFINNCWVGWV